MKLLSNTDITVVLNQEKVILLDSDFLGYIFRDKKLSQEFIHLAPNKFYQLFSFVEFEFLRDVFIPEQKTIREQFISNPPFQRLQEESYSTTMPKLLENALLLSKIYAHQIGTKGNRSNSSLVDLLLASFLMFNKDDTLLITGNKKDFPSCVFDVLSIINTEQNDGSIHAFCVLEFNPKKFDRCFEQLRMLEKRGKVL